MEPRFSIFVAHATLKAFEHLRDSGGEDTATITETSLNTAAKYGYRHALARLYPGHVRPPFKRDPLPDIVLTLRYQFEEDPEKLGLSLEETDKLLEKHQQKKKGVPRSGINTPPTASFPSSERLSKLNLRPTIHGDKMDTPPVEAETPLPISDSTSMKKIGSGAGVLFPWEKKKR